MNGYNWFLIVIVIVVSLLAVVVNVYILINFMHPEDKNEAYIPKIVVVSRQGARGRGRAHGQWEGERPLTTPPPPVTFAPLILTPPPPSTSPPLFPPPRRYLA